MISIRDAWTVPTRAEVDNALAFYAWGDALQIDNYSAVYSDLPDYADHLYIKSVFGFGPMWDRISRQDQHRLLDYYRKNRLGNMSLSDVSQARAFYFGVYSGFGGCQADIFGSQADELWSRFETLNRRSALFYESLTDSQRDTLYSWFLDWDARAQENCQLSE